MKYEISFIISSTVPENEHSKIQEEVLSYLDQAKAKHNKEFFSLGRKKLAYPIKKQRNGFYIFMVFEMDDKVGLKDLDTKMKHNGNILRHLVIKKDKVSSTKKASTQQAEGYKGESKDKEPLLEKKDDIKVDLGDIDKKLDNLLDT